MTALRAVDSAHIMRSGLAVTAGNKPTWEKCSRTVSQIFVNLQFRNNFNNIKYELNLYYFSDERLFIPAFPSDEESNLKKMKKILEIAFAKHKKNSWLVDVAHDDGSKLGHQEQKQKSRPHRERKTAG